MSTTKHRVLPAVIALGMLLAVTRPALAGPPLLCHPFDAGKAALLPWGDAQGWNSPDRSYDVQKLTADTLRLLSADTTVLARMENLRRATIYAAQDRRVAAELLSAVLGRARTAEMQGSGNQLAWFDAGYLVETYRQASHVFKWEMLSGGARSAWTLREEPAVDGYRLVLKALQLGSNPEMEFAASLMTNGSAGAEHRRRAADGATSGSLLARNLNR
jgi:hypothetical protein